MSAPTPDGGRHEKALRRNVVVSAFGTVARTTQVVLLFALGRLFGSSLLGEFLLGYGLFEIAIGVVAIGLTDGTTLLVSRHAARDDAGLDSDALTRVVGTALRVGGLLAIAVAVATSLVAGPIAARLTGPYAPVLSALPWLAWALVPALVARVCFAATSAFLRLEWEAIVGGAGPALGLLALLPVAKLAGAGLRGIFLSFLIVQTAVAVVALVALARRIGPDRLRAAFRRGPLDRALLRFALPQGLNMAANTYISRLDVLMLAGFGVPAATVGVYGAVAAVVRELRQIRMVVSGALAPIVARHDAEGDRGAIASALSRGAGWVASIAVPVALGFVVVRDDVLRLVAPAYDGGSVFVVVLLVGALTNTLGGLAGNFLVYLFQNRWNLANAVFAAALGSALGWLLVPRFGLTGAALAATLATMAVTLLENLELAVVERVHIAPRALARAGVTLAIGAAVLVCGFQLGVPGARTGTALRVALGVGFGLAAAVAVRGGAPLRGDAS